MSKFFYFTVFALFIFSSVASAGWTKADIGSGGFFVQSISVGVGRNDGVSECTAQMSLI